MLSGVVDDLFDTLQLVVHHRRHLTLAHTIAVDEDFRRQTSVHLVELDQAVCKTYKYKLYIRIPE